MSFQRLTQFLLVVFAMLFAVAPGASSQSAEEKIAFVHYDESADDSDIYVMDADGSNPTNLSNDARENGGPAWSPDGSLIAYTAFIPGANPWEGYTDIYVMNADGSNPTNLTNNSGYDTDPSWSPDGSQIAFSSLGRTPGFPFELEIYVMEADGSNPTPLTDHLDSYEPAWSPDGTQIAFTSAEGTSHEIYVIDADGSNPTNLTNTSPLVRDTAPAWSPDGTRIAFLSDRDGTLEIYVMDADGSNPTNLTNNDAQDNRDPAWSPDGSLIAFSSMRCGGDPWDCTEEIYVIDATDGSNETNLTGALPGNSFNPAWSPSNPELVPALTPPGLLGLVLLLTGALVATHRRARAAASVRQV